MNFISSFTKVLQGIQKEIADTEEKLGAITAMRRKPNDANQLRLQEIESDLAKLRRIVEADAEKQTQSGGSRLSV